MKGDKRWMGTLVLGLGLVACSTAPEPPVESERMYPATSAQLSTALRDLAPGIRPNASWSPYAVSASTEHTLTLSTDRLDVPNTRATTTFRFEEVGATTKVTASTTGMRGDLANSMNHVFLTRLGAQF